MAEFDQLAKQMDLITLKSEHPKELVILYDRETLKHHSTKIHPENPMRLEKILESLKENNILSSDKVKVISTLSIENMI